MSMVGLFTFFVFLSLCCPASSVVCYFCEGLDNNCMGATCVGAYCVKRAALVNGVYRTQKMCRNADMQLGIASGAINSIMSLGGGGYSNGCNPAILWQGAPGTECVCASDYCNSTTHFRSNAYWLSLSTIICLIITLFL